MSNPFPADVEELPNDRFAYRCANCGRRGAVYYTRDMAHFDGGQHDCEIAKWHEDNPDGTRATTR